MVDFPDGLPLDHMHLVSLGQFKTFFSRWFDSKYKDEEYYIGNSYFMLLNCLHKIKNIH